MLRVRHLLHLLLVPLCAAPLAAPLAAQRVRPGLPGTVVDTSLRRPTGTIDGFVSDSNLTPIQAAQVSILRTSVKIGTGPNGRFRIRDVPTGQYLVIVRRVGYHPISAIVEVPAHDTLRLTYTLQVAATELDPVIIAGERRRSLRLQEFENRRKLGTGQFLTQEDIDKQPVAYATELFRKFLSVNVSPDLSQPLPVYYALSRREGGDPNVGACPMQVFLDGTKLPTPFNLDLLPSPRELGGIEVYSGSSTTPPQYSGFNTGCGVILVWTKDGFQP